MILTATEGLGLELCNLLRDHLGIPPNVSRFSVHFDPKAIITVDCTYYPEAPEEDPDATVARVDPIALHNARKL